PVPSRRDSTPPHPRPTLYPTSPTTPNHKPNHPPTPHPGRHHNPRTTPHPPHHRAAPGYRPYLRACHKAPVGDPPGAEQTSLTAAADCSEPTPFHPADGSSGCLPVGSDPGDRVDGRRRLPHTQVSNGAWPRQGQHACRPRRRGRRSTPPRRAPPPHAPSADPPTTGPTTTTSQARTHPTEATPKPPTYPAHQADVPPAAAAPTTQRSTPPEPQPQKKATSGSNAPAPQ